MKNILKLSRKSDYKNLSLISGNMSRLLESGVNLIKIFEILTELPIRKQYKISLLEIKELVKKGESLEEAFLRYKDIYPNHFIGMISIGEKNGSLSKTLKSLEIYYDKLHYIKSSMINSMAYPIILLIAMIILLLFIAFFFIPSLSEFYNNLSLEKPKVIIIIKNFTDFIKDKPLVFYMYLIIWGIIIPFIIIKNLRLKKVIKPLKNIKLVKDFYELIFIYTLSVIIKSGINLSLGLQHTKDSFRNTTLGDMFNSLSENILNGFTLYESFSKENLYSNYTLSIIKISEEGGSIEEGLDNLSKNLEMNYLNRINKALSFLQPSLIILMGLFIMTFIMIFILPMVDSIFESGF